MNFDCIFIDNTTPKPYSESTLNNSPMGGTEASIVRLAEGLGKAGLKVGVFIHNSTRIEMGTHAYYLPINELGQINKVHTVVALRGIGGISLFPASNKISWQHDIPDARCRQWNLKDIKVICVSDWHKSRFQYEVCDKDRIDNPKVNFIYNIVPDDLYIPRKQYMPIDNNQLVWLSSPHKGLEEALKLFKIVKEFIPQLTLRVFNPGYLSNEYRQQPGVIIEGAHNYKHMWSIARESLAVFYPTTFQETFGCVAAEANAQHVPVLCYRTAGIREALNHDDSQLIELGKYKDYIDRLISWHKGDRPFVHGNGLFKESEIIPKWIRLIEGKNI